MDSIDRRQFVAGSLAAMLPGTLASAPVPRSPRVAPDLPPHFRESPLPRGVYQRLGSARFRVTANNAELWLTPDGRHLVTGDHFQTKVWDLSDGLCVAEHFVFHPILHRGFFVYAVDDRHLLCVDQGLEPRRTVQWVDLLSGRIVKSVSTDVAADSVAVDPTGKRMLAVSGRDRVECFDCHRGTRLWSIACQSPGDEPFAFSDDGSRAAIAFDGKASIVDLRNGFSLNEFPLRTSGAADRLVLSRTGTRVAEWTEVGNVTLRTAVSGEDLWKKKLLGDTNAVRFLPDDSAVLVCCDRNILLFDRKSGKERLRFSGVGAVRIAISRDAKIVVAENEDGGLEFLDLQTGLRMPHSSDPPGRIGEVKYLSLRHVVGRAESSLTVWDLAGRSARAVRAPVEGHGERPTIAVAPDGVRHAAFVTGRVSIFEADGKRTEIALKAPGRVVGVEWIDPTTVLAATDTDFVAIDCADGSSESFPCERRGRPSQVLASGDRTTAYFLSADVADINNGAKVCYHLSRFDLATRKLTHLKLAYPPDLIHLCTSIDGRFLSATEALVGNEWAVVIRSGRTGAVLRTIPEIVDGTPSGIAPDGRTVALHRTVRLPVRASIEEGAGEEAEAPTPIEYEEIQFVEFGTWGIRRRLPQTSPPSFIAFSPDGRTLATAHDDAPVYLWDIYGERTNPLPKPDAAGLRTAWADLASPDAECAFLAMCTLIQHPKVALPMIAANLTPAVAPDPKRVQHTVESLADRDYRTREAAERELAPLVEELRPQLQAAYEAGTHGPEAGQRLERLLNRTPRATARSIRPVRAHEVLERIGTAAAKAIVAASAGGAPRSDQTLDAVATLRRWDFCH